MFDLFNQPAFNWNNSTHERERSIPGQQYLDRNRKRFGGQNRRIIEALMIPGNELDSSIVRKWKPEIWNLNSRCSDLRNIMKFRISSKPHLTKKLVVCYCTEEDRKHNQKILNTLNLQPQR